MKKLSAIFFAMVITMSAPLAFADDRDGKLEFASTLEETLGHFWALEKNLDDKNAKLALVHASHPIAELYGTMQPYLTDNPDFDKKLRDNLLELQNKATINVSREQAQDAIEESKAIVQQAREIVVGDLSNDNDFKMQLIQGLLQTSIIEYHEAVSDGIIKEMAEFQDGSSFVWESQQIYNTLEGIDPKDSERIDSLYAELWTVFENNVEPKDQANLADALTNEFEELSGISIERAVIEEDEFPAPLKQIKEGIAPKDVQCNAGMHLMYKLNGNVACIKESSVVKLLERGWTE